MAENAGGAVNWMADLILKPGTGVRLVPAINVVLAFILLILIALVVSGEASIHVFVMGFLAVGLLASVNWFMLEFQKVKAQQEREGNTDGATIAAGSTEQAPPREKAD